MSAIPTSTYSYERNRDQQSYNKVFAIKDNHFPDTKLSRFIFQSGESNFVIVCLGLSLAQIFKRMEI